MLNQINKWPLLIFIFGLSLALSLALTAAKSNPASSPQTPGINIIVQLNGDKSAAEVRIFEASIGKNGKKVYAQVFDQYDQDGRFNFAAVRAKTYMIKAVPAPHLLGGLSFDIDGMNYLNNTKEIKYNGGVVKVEIMIKTNVGQPSTTTAPAGTNNP